MTEYEQHMENQKIWESYLQMDLPREMQETVKDALRLSKFYQAIFKGK